MKASEFINTFAFARCLEAMNKGNFDTLERAYDAAFFLIPRLYCKDGFNISVQVNNANYCGSENGTRTFGLDWQFVEWGYPSSHIDGKKYNAESSPTTESVGGYVEVDLIDELCEQHGGFDYLRTLCEYYENKNTMKEIGIL